MSHSRDIRNDERDIRNDETLEHIDRTDGRVVVERVLYMAFRMKDGISEK